MDFIPGKTIKKSDIQSKENLLRFAWTLKNLHGAEFPFFEALSPIQTFYIVVANGEKRSAQYPLQFEVVKKMIDEIDGVIQLNPIEPRPAHLDLTAQNILLNDDGIVLIDWENGGLSDPYFDLSMVSIFLRFDVMEEKNFLAAYFGRSPTQFEWDRYIVIKPVCLFLRAAAALSGSSKVMTDAFYNEMLNSQGIPECGYVLQLLEEGNLDLPRWKVGLAFMKGGMELVESDRFKASFQRLKAPKIAIF